MGALWHTATNPFTNQTTNYYYEGPIIYLHSIQFTNGSIHGNLLVVFPVSTFQKHLKNVSCQHHNDPQQLHFHFNRANPHLIAK